MLVCGALSLHAQRENDHVQWEMLTPEITGRPGDVVNVQVRASVAPEAHMYSMYTYPEDVLGPQPTVITVGGEGFLSLTSPVSSDVLPIRKYDENFELTTEFWKGDVIFTIPVTIATTATPGTHEGWVNFTFMTCTDQFCRPPIDTKLTVAITVAKNTRRK